MGLFFDRGLVRLVERGPKIGSKIVSKQWLVWVMVNASGTNRFMVKLGIPSREAMARRLRKTKPTIGDFWNEDIKLFGAPTARMLEVFGLGAHIKALDPLPTCSESSVAFGRVAGHYAQVRAASACQVDSADAAE